MTSIAAPLGRTLLLAALALAAAGSVAAFAAAVQRSSAAARRARWLAYGHAAAIAAAALVMEWALVAHDFSVGYVAQVGSRSVPLWVTIVSLWSSLEGSILFWCLVLALFIAVATAVAWRRLGDELNWALGVWLACAAFFAFLVCGPAQPFLSMSPVPADGPGPNPLLQNHVLMAIHPPMLYLGYVGMTIPFGLACAALFAGRLGPALLRALRTSLLLAWGFLTVAIVLGGWWAYEVLGWGGYWAWDPVENASFLPWLTATAALHSAIVLERRQALRAWTLTLVAASFLLTILGTFMTRSGVFNSVHSFTQSAIGPTILVFLAIATLGVVALLAARVEHLAGAPSVDAGASRETAFLFNNLLFVLFTFTVLLGTLFPLVVEAAQGRQMSVGRPYFDRMAVPVGLALLLLMGVGPALPWGRARRGEARRALTAPLAGAVVLLAVGFAAGARNPWTLATLAAAGYTAQVTLAQLLAPAAERRRARGESWSAALAGTLTGGGRRRAAAYAIHTGAALAICAIAVSSTMGSSKDVTLALGESVEVGRYTLTFRGAEEQREAHRSALVATVEVASGARVLGTLTPRMNFYAAEREPVGTPAVRSALSHDLYLSILNIDPVQQSVGLHAMVNPMVGWIWAAAGVMALGALAALVPVRRRAAASERPAESRAAELVPGAGAMVVAPNADGPP